MQKEAQYYIKKCDQCQKFAPNIHQPEGILNPLSSPWPFAQWGLDIVRPFSKTTGNKRWLLVDTDYFTKWVTAEPLANIRDMDAKRFVWKNIVTRFGIPHTFISNNSLQFDNKAFKRYYCDLGITNRYSTPAYPQGNEQVKAVNKVIVNGLKKRPDDAKEKWVEELPHVLWTYRTTPCRSTRETPFSITYDCNSSRDRIPKIEDKLFHSEQQWWAVREEFKFNWRAKRKWHSSIGVLSTQAQARVWLKCEVKAISAWGLSIKKGFWYCKEPRMGKVRAQLGMAISYHLGRGIGTYYLENLHENVVPHSWNVNNLQMYYY